MVASSGLLVAHSVIIAAGRPAAAVRLLPARPRVGDLGPEVTAACLDAGLRGWAARGGLGGRRAVDATGLPGVYLAGDWVGPTGLVHVIPDNDYCVVQSPAMRSAPA